MDSDLSAVSGIRTRAKRVSVVHRTLTCSCCVSGRRPTTADEITHALSFALRYRGRKRVHDADDVMARITAERLVRHLEASGFVLMKGPARAAPAVGRSPGVRLNSHAG
jgi:hypothetical protein